MGDWGKPQQARLSYKCYACANAAIGGVALCTGLPAPFVKAPEEAEKT